MVKKRVVRLTESDVEKLVKKILKEGDWDFVTQFEPSEEMFRGANEISGKGWHWKISDFDTWAELYNNLQSINRFNPKWSIRPDIEGGKKFFDLYLEKKGDLNVFLPYDKENVYIWFDGMSDIVDKYDNLIKKPKYGRLDL